MPGAYCQYCGHRCFVYRILPDRSWFGHMATCAAGMAHDRKVTGGYDHTTAIHPHGDLVEHMRAEPAAAEPQRCGRQTGPGEHCDSPRAEYANACGFHLTAELERLRRTGRRFADIAAPAIDWPSGLRALSQFRAALDGEGS